jgi:hypothetical protein
LEVRNSLGDCFHFYGHFVYLRTIRAHFLLLYYIIYQTLTFSSPYFASACVPFLSHHQRIPFPTCLNKPWRSDLSHCVEI